MDEEEYAIVSKKEFLALKKELDKLKKNPLEGSETGENLQSSIDNLSKSLNVMLEVFKQAAEDMKLEEHESETVGKQLNPMNEKLDTLIDQNQKIAKGIVAIADMVKEKLEEISEKAESKPRLPPLGPAPSPRQMPPPSQSFNPMPPPPSSSGMPQFGGLPPLGAPEGFEEPDFGSLPPLSPPGAPPGQQRRNVMGGLMK
ncbi:hypothetical protein HZB90_03660 [archaeon]|nr:hypothetical protein [archaeon]